MNTLHPKLQVLFLYLSNAIGYDEYTYSIRDGRFFTIADHFPMGPTIKMLALFGCEMKVEFGEDSSTYWYFQCRQ